MKLHDTLLERWQSIVAQKGDAPAIFNTRAHVARTFRQVDERANDFESKIDNFKARSVIAVQIGNHEDWPSILIACLRRGVVVMPLEQSISDQQRDAALKTCKAAGVVTAGGTYVMSSGVETSLDISEIVRDSMDPLGMTKAPMETSATKTRWGTNQPALLKLTSGTTAAPRAIRF